MNEIELARNAKLRKEKKQRILEIMAQKQDEKLKDMSFEELEKMVDEL
jgi:hypothetical protein